MLEPTAERCGQRPGRRARAGRRSSAAPRRRTRSRRSPRAETRARVREARPRRVASSRSANAMPTLPGLAVGGAVLAARDGRRRRCGRSAAARGRSSTFARLPWPSALPSAFIPAASAYGPLTTTTGPGGAVVATTPCSANVLAAGGLDRGEHDRQLGPGAAGHDRVDRDLLDGRAAAVGRHDADEVLRMARRVLEHRDDALGRRRDNRQPVGHAARVQRLERVLELADRRARARRSGPRRARAAPRAAARPRDRACARRTRAASRAGRRAQRAARLPTSAASRSRWSPSTRSRSSPSSSSEHGRHRGGVERVGQRELVVDLRARARARAARPARRSPRARTARPAAPPAASSAGSTWSQTGQSCLTSASTSSATP